MKLSVVMAVRNGAAYLSEAVESVLAQSFSDFEFLIVDDASTDDTAEILRAYQRRDSRIVVRRNQTNLGPYPSVNRALRLARGSLIARHDADDISLPNRFSIQLNAFASHEDVALITGAMEVFGDAEVSQIRHIPAWQPRLEWELLFKNVIGAGAVMFPRVVRGVAVLFQERYAYAEDYGLWCHLSRLGRVVSPKQVVYRFRRHPCSISSLKTVEQDDYGPDPVRTAGSVLPIPRVARDDR